MSVTTAADEARDEARGQVQDAVRSLTPVVINRDLWGWDEYTPEYTRRLEKAMRLLCEVRDLLDPLRDDL